MKQTYIDQLTRTDAGYIEVRMKKLTGGTNSDGTPEFRYHRTVVEPGGDVDAQIDAVNKHIATGEDQVAFVPCPPEDRPLVKAMQARVPATVVADHQAKKAEEQVRQAAAKARADQAAADQAAVEQAKFDAAVAAAVARSRPA